MKKPKKTLQEAADQLDWVNELEVPHNTSSTSRKSADALKPHFGPIARRIYEDVHNCGSFGATREEIIGRLLLRESTACGALNKLERHPVLYTYEERKRRATSGLEVFIYFAHKIKGLKSREELKKEEADQ